MPSAWPACCRPPPGVLGWGPCRVQRGSLRRSSVGFYHNWSPEGGLPPPSTPLGSPPACGLASRPCCAQPRRGEGNHLCQEPSPGPPRFSRRAHRATRTPLLKQVLGRGVRVPLGHCVPCSWQWPRAPGREGVPGVDRGRKDAARATSLNPYHPGDGWIHLAHPHHRWVN